MSDIVHKAAFGGVDRRVFNRNLHRPESVDEMNKSTRITHGAIHDALDDLSSLFEGLEAVGTLNVHTQISMLIWSYA